MSNFTRILTVLLVALSIVGCASTQPKPYDYTAYKASDPKSILVLPPINHSPEIKASAGVLSHATIPLAESGYYVFPVAAVTETFKANGMDTPDDIHNISLNKLNEIFGADAVLYIRVKEYGSSYQVIQSETKVIVEAELKDAKTGALLWKGTAAASDKESGAQSNGLWVQLIVAVVEQVSNTLGDKGYNVAQTASARLLYANEHRGVLFGPYSHKYHKNLKAN